MNSNSRLIAKAALLDGQGNVLVLTRSETDKRRPGEFDFPGGTIEPGESAELGAAREIEEEIGVVIAPEDLNLGYSATQYYEGKSMIRFLFFATIAPDTPVKLSFEHSKWRWMPLKDMLATYSHPVYVDGMKYLLEHDLLK